MRVIEFIPHIDYIPEGSKFLFTVATQIPIEESEAEKTKRIVTGDENPNNTFTFARVCYEVSDKGFEELVKQGFFKKDVNQRAKEFQKLVNLIP